MIVDSIMTRRVVTVDAAATARDAARLLRDRRIGGAVVVRAGLAVGILTERDLVQRVLAQGRDPDATRVADVMSHPVATVEPSASVDEAARRMKELGIKRLVVVLGDDLRGIVTATDVAYARPEASREIVETWIKPRWDD